MPVGPRVGALACAVVAFVVVVLAGGLADAAAPEPVQLDLGRLAGSVELVEQTFVLEDHEGKLGLSDVMKPDARFVRARQEASFGFSRAAYWVRFEAVNPGPRAQAWLLEIAYPHLDRIDLYARADDGTVRHRRAGDRIPFGMREVDVANFVFPEETPAGHSTTFYVRVQSDGAVRIPLRAWLPLEFASFEGRRNIVLWLFYGIVVAMTFYNVGAAYVLNKREHIYYVVQLIAMGGAAFTMGGQTFQYLLPNQPLLANRALGVCLATAMLFLQLYAREVHGQFGRPKRLDGLLHLFKWTVPPSVLVVAVSLFAPIRTAQLTVVVAMALYVPVGLYKIARAVLYGDAQLRTYAAGMIVIAVTIPIAMLAYVRIIPPYALAIWAAHLGGAAYSILTSLSLPIRVNDLGRRLEGLNEQLSQNVNELRLALAQAERATKVKDEFMATMSHELRTPLNAIINVPQGLLDDFPVVAGASCTSCREEFQLEAGDSIGPDTVCPVCERRGSLRLLETTMYTGSPAHTARFLRKIERSGHHLLQMVNGVLDFSKMEAGRLELAREPVDLGAFLTDVVDQMNDLARSRGLTIELAMASTSDPCVIDATRIRQVLMNLLSNAIKFSTSGSAIHVEWTHSSDAERIAVRDQGIGIAPENHQRIFASFEQVHKGDTRKYGGTGLGLSISRSLVRMHGGDLWVESQLGKGSTFIFTLPRQLSRAGDAELRRAEVA